MIAMHDLPIPVQDLPENVVKYAPHAWIAWFVLSRAWKNWKADGGWYGVKRAFLSGEKIAEAKAIDDAKDVIVADAKRATKTPFPLV